MLLLEFRVPKVRPIGPILYSHSVSSRSERTHVNLPQDTVYAFNEARGCGGDADGLFLDHKGTEGNLVDELRTREKSRAVGDGLHAPDVVSACQRRSSEAMRTTNWLVFTLVAVGTYMELAPTQVFELPVSTTRLTII